MRTCGKGLGWVLMLEREVSWMLCATLEASDHVSQHVSPEILVFPYHCTVETHHATSTSEKAYLNIFVGIRIRTDWAWLLIRWGSRHVADVSMKQEREKVLAESISGIAVL